MSHRGANCKYLIRGGRSGESAPLLGVTSGRASRQPRRANFGRLLECQLRQGRGWRRAFLRAARKRGPFARTVRALDQAHEKNDGHESAR